MIIGSRYNGPLTSGNGGYSAGLVAAQAPWPGAVEVTLRQPPPLDTELAVAFAADLIQVTAPDGGLVAEGRPTEPPTDTVPPVSHDEAVAVSRAYPGFTTHPFPTCFVCGVARPGNDGLGIYPGRLPDRRTAAPFTVPGDVSPELIWAALDCPGGWTVAQEGRPYVLGRCTTWIDKIPDPGAECVAMGQIVGEDGRKAFTITTLYAAGGGVLATARATWIAI